MTGVVFLLSSEIVHDKVAQLLTPNVVWNDPCCVAFDISNTVYRYIRTSCTS